MNMLEKDILKEFQAVVGPENVNDGAPICEVYAYNWCQEFVNYMENKEPIPFSPVPKAVILPSNTEEVQKIVKLCNKYEIIFKVQSTGLGPWNQPSTDNSVILDMRRMNRIVKIDEKNMYCVVEPYVSGGQLQVEIMKYGLNCHMPGAGPMASPLASATSMNGPGFTSPVTGHSARNVLGVEWVLPDGKLMRLGALGLKNGSDWYNGDGPGPSLRGIMRGWAGAKSGIGVFTRVAIKLFPYPCSTEFKISGHSPNYDFEIPNYNQVYVIDVKKFKHLEKALLRISNEEIAFMCSHMSGFAVAAIFSNSIESLIDKMSLASLKVPIVVIITGITKREFEYKQKVMKMILEELKVEDIISSGKFTPPKSFYAEHLRANLGYHGFIATGGFQSAAGPADALALVSNVVNANVKVRQDKIKKGLLANDFALGAWGTTYEHGHYAHCELPIMYDQTNEESVKAMAEVMEESNEVHLKERIGVPFFIEGDEQHKVWGPKVMNYHIWLRKIKEAFDPNSVADSGFYISKSCGKKESEIQNNSKDFEN